MEIKSNISFSKLSKNINKIIDRTLHNSAQDSADLSRLNIDQRSGNGVNFLELSEHSLNYRKQGVFRTGEVKIIRGKNVKTVKYPKLEKRTPTTSDKPLKYTGNLYNSIKAKKNSLTMTGYGALHDEGYKTNAYNVPSRPFIETTVGEDTKDKFFKDIEKNLKK